MYFKEDSIMDINGQDLIRACSAIGAGLAVIAGIRSEEHTSELQSH